MKNLKLVISALLLMAVLVGIGIAAIPAPPANQNMGLPDTLLVNISTTTCEGCHPAAPDIHHFMLGTGSTNLGCLDCHPMTGPIGSQTLTIEQVCLNCHNGTAWGPNPAINLSQIRPPGRPHHNTTKNSSSSTFQFAYKAINRQCNVCHGSSIIANYNDGHSVPTYNLSIVTPLADFKINATVGGGREWGGCAACHDTGIVSGLYVNTNHDTHHGETSGMLGRQCNYCHVASGFRAEPIPDWSPEPNANPLRIYLNQSYPSYTSMFKWDTSIKHVELRNATIYNSGDVVNGTGCQKCHTVQNLHNIQFNAATTIPGEIPGYGHIANNSDCNGCHQGWFLGTTDPFPGPRSIELDSVTPGELTADVPTAVVISGSNFVQEGYTTNLLVDDGIVGATIADTQITTTLTLGVGVHSVQVEKGGLTSGISTVTVVSPVTIASAKLVSGVLTITGTGFGTVAQQIVTINKAGEIILPSDSITGWSDTSIVATSAAAAVGDTVTVTTSTGSATATIEAGVVPPSITVTSPNGGETWKRGSTHAITWTKVGTMGAYVKIELLKGTSATTIKSSTSNSGTYTWKIPSGQSTGSTYKIRITSLDTPSYTDTSDNTFTISR